MSAVRNDERYAKFLELMPKNKFNVKKSAEEAGFGKAYARTAQKSIMAKAIRFQLERSGIQVAKVQERPVMEAKRTMAEIIGFSRQEIMDNIKYLAEQTKDMGVRLRVVSPLAKEYGVDLSPEQTQGQLPVLNISVTQRGSTEPLAPRRTIYIGGRVVDGTVVEGEEVGGGGQPTVPDEVVAPTPPL